MSKRADFKAFAREMLGSSETKPLETDAGLVNGAFLNALIDAWKACEGEEGPGAPKGAGHDPLAAHRVAQ